MSHQFSREIAHTLYSRNRFIFEAQDGSSMPEPFELFCKQIPRRHKKPRRECGTKESYCWFQILGLNLQFEAGKGFIARAGSKVACSSH